MPDKENTMRAMVLREYNSPLVLEQRPIPIIKRDQILLKVEACGICGTDLKITKGQLPSIIKLPHVPGHELGGEVVEVGEDVKNIKVGQRGIGYTYLPCHDCHQCRTGKQNVCSTITRLGFEHDGGFGEYVALPAYGFCPIPADEKVSDYAVLTDAALTPFHSIVALGKVKAGDSVLVVGVGALGLYALQIAKLSGATVIVADIKEEALENAKSYGADATINTKKEDLEKSVKELTNGNGVDVAFDGVGYASTFVPTLKCVTKGGTLLLTGYDPINSLPLDALGMHYNEWTVIGTRLGTKEELLRLIDLTYKKKLKPIISKYYPFNEVNRALEELSKGQVIGRIVLTGWND